MDSSEKLLPKFKIKDYTQALMDFDLWYVNL